MTRPVDIRDLARRDAELTDARLGLDADDNLAMTNQPDNSTIGTAASRDVGTAPDQIPLNSDLPESAKTGDYNDLLNLPTLGTVAEKDTGTATGKIPTADDLGMVGGQVNLTSNSIELSTFDGVGTRYKARNKLGITVAAGATVAGSALRLYVTEIGGASTDFVVLSGTYKNVSGQDATEGIFADFEKVS